MYIVQKQFHWNDIHAKQRIEEQREQTTELTDIYEWPGYVDSGDKLQTTP